MILEHIGLSQINGSLVVLDGVKGVQYDEMAELHLDDGSTRVGRVVEVEGDRCIIQVFEGTRGLSLVNNRTVLTGHPMMMDLSPELPGRVLDGLGRPIDGLGDIYPAAAAMSTAHLSTPSAVCIRVTTSTPAFLPSTAWPR